MASRNRSENSTAVKKHVTRVRRSYAVEAVHNNRILHSEKRYIEQMVLVLRLARYSNTQISKIIGIPIVKVKEVLDTPEVAEALLELREALPQAALDLLQNYMIEAIQAIVDVMRTTGDDRLVLQAAADILDRSGIPKTTKTSSHKISESKLTVTDDGIVDRLREAPVEVQEEAAQMIERLEQLLASPTEES